MLTSEGLDPHDAATAARLWNCDKTAFCMSVSAKKLIARREAKAVCEIGGGSGHEYTTYCTLWSKCFWSTAASIHPLQGQEHVSKMGPAAAVYGVTDYGWMDAANFLSWFLKLFVPAVSHLTGSCFFLMDTIPTSV